LPIVWADTKVIVLLDRYKQNGMTVDV